MVIGIPPTHSVEVLGIFSKDPQVLHSFYYWDRRSDKPSLRRCAISSFNLRPNTHTLPPTQADPFHIGKEAVIG